METYLKIVALAALLYVAYELLTTMQQSQKSKEFVEEADTLRMVVELRNESGPSSLVLFIVAESVEEMQDHLNKFAFCRVLAARVYSGRDVTHIMDLNGVLVPHARES